VDSNSCVNNAFTAITVQSCIGIDDGLEGIGIIVYPNATRGQFTIQKTANLNKSVAVRLLDTNSKLIIQKVIPSGTPSVEMDITHCSTGIYFVHLIIDGELFVMEVLKN
jgi:hypothetical protein